MAVNANVKVDIGVHSSIRQNGLPFRPTITYTQDFHYSTTLDGYPNDVQTMADQVWGYVEMERAKGANPNTHISLTVDNPTHPPVAAGVVKLPKGHLDTGLTNLDFATKDTFKVKVMDKLADLRSLAKY